MSIAQKGRSSGLDPHLRAGGGLPDEGVSCLWHRLLLARLWTIQALA